MTYKVEEWTRLEETWTVGDLSIWCAYCALDYHMVLLRNGSGTILHNPQKIDVHFQYSLDLTRFGGWIYLASVDRSRYSTCYFYTTSCCTSTGTKLISTL